MRDAVESVERGLSQAAEDQHWAVSRGHNSVSRTGLMVADVAATSARPCEASTHANEMTPIALATPLSMIVKGELVPRSSDGSLGP